MLSTRYVECGRIHAGLHNILKRYRFWEVHKSSHSIGQRAPWKLWPCVLTNTTQDQTHIQEMQILQHWICESCPLAAGERETSSEYRTQDSLWKTMRNGKRRQHSSKPQRVKTRHVTDERSSRLILENTSFNDSKICRKTKINRLSKNVMQNFDEWARRNITPTLPPWKSQIPVRRKRHSPRPSLASIPC